MYYERCYERLYDREIQNAKDYSLDNQVFFIVKFFPIIRAQCSNGYLSAGLHDTKVSTAFELSLHLHALVRFGIWGDNMIAYPRLMSFNIYKMLLDNRGKHILSNDIE